MAAEREAEVISMVDVPSRDPKRVGKIDALITYRVGPFQSGLVYIPKEKVTEDAVQKAIAADVEAKGKFVGKKFKV